MQYSYCIRAIKKPVQSVPSNPLVPVLCHECYYIGSIHDYSTHSKDFAILEEVINRWFPVGDALTRFTFPIRSLCRSWGRSPVRASSRSCLSTYHTHSSVLSDTVRRSCVQPPACWRMKWLPQGRRWPLVYFDHLSKDCCVSYNDVKYK